MLTWLAALLIVGAGCLLLSLGGTGAFLWGWRAVRRGGRVGIAGVALTVAASINLAVPRTCDDTVPPPERNRPAVSAFAGEGRCQRHGLAQVQLVILLALVTSLAVHQAERRRPPEADSSARH